MTPEQAQGALIVLAAIALLIAVAAIHHTALYLHSRRRRLYTWSCLQCGYTETIRARTDHEGFQQLQERTKPHGELHTKINPTLPPITSIITRPCDEDIK